MSPVQSVSDKRFFRPGWFWAAPLAAVAVSSPPLSPWLQTTMAGHMLVQMPLLLLLGGAWGGRVTLLPAAADPWGLTGLVWFVGTHLFWWIPRSLDLATLQPGWGALMHGSLFAAGWALGQSWARAPFALQGTLAVHLVALLLAMGVIYQGALFVVCQSYPLEQQQEMGGLLFWGAGGLYLLLVVWAGIKLGGKKIG
ncbi:MAG: hypothetical protein OEW12_02305 [Deltaproteobacteria bacterium]|nr:hypothetical protein [Deltaproteobacteria bacterium]